MATPSKNHVRTDGRLISRVEPVEVVERRVHGPASDGYLSVVTWRGIHCAGRPVEWFAVDLFELSPHQQRELWSVLGEVVGDRGAARAAEASR